MADEPEIPPYYRAQNAVLLAALKHYTTPSDKPEHDQTYIDLLTATKELAEATHTTEEDFQHFLAYTGMTDAHPNLILWLRYAYFHGANDKEECAVLPLPARVTVVPQ